MTNKSDSARMNQATPGRKTPRIVSGAGRIKSPYAAPSVAASSAWRGTGGRPNTWGILLSYGPVGGVIVLDDEVHDLVVGAGALVRRGLVIAGLGLAAREREERDLGRDDEHQDDETGDDPR